MSKEPPTTEESPPSPLDVEGLAKVVTKVSMGVEPQLAARSEGIPEAEWNAWLNRGRHGEQPYAELLDQVERAEIDAEVLAIGRINAAAREGNWSAAAWLAERRWPERWARKSIAGKDAPRDGQLPPGIEDPFARLDNVAQLRPRERAQ